MKQQWVRIPVPTPLNPVAVWEHTPLDYYGRGEYPRFLRPVGPRAGDHETRWERRPDHVPGSLK